MKIAFFSEAGYTGIPPRNHPNARVDVAWPIILEANHHPVTTIHTLLENSYDIGVLIIPKNKEIVRDYPMVEELKRVSNRVAMVQEGAHWYFQDYEIQDQIWYFNVLMEMDFILAHNQSDKKYYAGLTGKPTFVMPTVMIEDTIVKSKVNPQGTIVGGNWVSVYGGFDSYTIAQELDESISALTTGRMKPEEKLLDINHLEWMQWNDWINKLSEFKYGVQLQKTFSAGTFALNCAFWKIPCIGYKGLDTQEILHPLTTVEPCDLESAREVARKLKDEEFYKSCQNIIGERYKQHYTEDKFLQNWKEIEETL